MKTISTTSAPAAIGPYSQAVITGNLLFVSGQIPLSPETGEVCGKDIHAQTEQVMNNIKAVLTAAGCDFDDVVKTTCFLTDINDFASFNQIYAQYFTGKPARSCVAVSALPKGVSVEVEVIANLGIAKKGNN
ncbi:MAG: RidA family protein [Oscillospiraceae bacterium]|nr:RidA family protein [Oscillospiraceae bacterium]